MKLTINGFPKSGNHALMKACELLGHPAQVEHIPFAQGLPEGTTHHIFIKRDPRNVVISALRHIGNHVTPGTILSSFKKFEFQRGILHGEGSLVKLMGDYEGWLDDKKTLVVSYEELTNDATGMKMMAEYLGTPYMGGFENLEGLTMTWNKVHSDFRIVFTSELHEQWAKEGGTDLLMRWGYHNTDNED